MVRAKHLGSLAAAGAQALRQLRLQWHPEQHAARLQGKAQELSRKGPGIVSEGSVMCCPFPSRPIALSRWRASTGDSCAQLPSVYSRHSSSLCSFSSAYRKSSERFREGFPAPPPPPPPRRLVAGRDDETRRRGLRRRGGLLVRCGALSVRRRLGCQLEASGDELLAELAPLLRAWTRGGRVGGAQYWSAAAGSDGRQQPEGGAGRHGEEEECRGRPQHRTRQGSAHR